MIYVPAEAILSRFAFVCVSCNCCCFLFAHVNSLGLKCGLVKAGVQHMVQGGKKNKNTDLQEFGQGLIWRKFVKQQVHSPLGPHLFIPF